MGRGKGSLLWLLLLRDAGATDAVLVTDESSGTVAVIDPRADRVTATIAVGKRPRGIQMSNEGRTAYVALSGSPASPPGTDPSTLPPADRSADGIGVLDLGSHRIVRVLSSGQDPESFALGTGETRLYVSNEETAGLSVVDVAKGTVLARVPVGEEPEGVRIRPDGQVVYVTNEADGTVSVVDTRTHAVVATIPTGKRPRAVAFTPDGSRAYVTDEASAALTVVDAARHEPIGTIDLAAAAGVMPARPMGMAMARDGRTLYVTNGRAGTVAVVDTERLLVTQTIHEVGARPWGIALADDKLYVANGPSGDVAVIDTRTDEVVARIPVGGSPWGVATRP